MELSDHVHRIIRRMAVVTMLGVTLPYCGLQTYEYIVTKEALAQHDCTWAASLAHLVERFPAPVLLGARLAIGHYLFGPRCARPNGMSANPDTTQSAPQMAAYVMKNVSG